MLKTRIITAIVALAVLALVLFVLPPLAAELVIALLILAAAWEWSGFLEAKTPATRVFYVVFIAALMAGFGMVWPDGVERVLMVAMGWWLIALIWTFAFPTPIPQLLRWICGALVLVPLYAALVLLYQATPSLLLFVLLIVWAADIGAYFCGKRFGRVKLAPSISPGKTWEGVIGGLLLVAALAVARSLWFENDLLVIVPFCLGVASISVVGDLTVSMFKRTAGVKDSGTLFPGHGGILDRVDSVAAAAPVFALGMGWAGLV